MVWRCAGAFDQDVIDPLHIDIDGRRIQNDARVQRD